MVEKYYLDTCIWRDYLENRYDSLKPLGEFSLQLINKIVEDENILCYSDIVIKELKKALPQEEITDLISIIPQHLRLKLTISRQQAHEAKKLMRTFNIPFGDAMHAILTRDANAILRPTFVFTRETNRCRAA